MSAEIKPLEPTIGALTDSTFGPEEKALARDVAKYLSARGVPTKWAVECGVGMDTATRLRGDGTDVRGAVVFVYLDHDGRATPHKRWRLRDENGFRVERKFHQRAGSGVHVYIPPVRHKTLTMQNVLRDAKQPLVIAEGETRALALGYHGIPTVAIGGIDMWGKDGELCSDLQRIPMEGREVLYVFDADVRTRRDKQRSVVRFTQRLKERGAVVRWLPMPDLGDGVTGADDFVAQRGIRAFRNLIKTDAKRSEHPEFASWGDDGVRLDLTLTPVSSEWLHAEPPALEWTIDGYLPRRASGLLVAQGGVGKTILSQSIAQAIAGGRPFLGRPTRHGKVVHIACEEGPDELRRRQYRTHRQELADMRAAHATQSAMDAFSRSLERRLFVKSVVGQELFLIVMDGGNVVQGKALDVLIFQLRALGDVELLIIDPLSRVHSCDDENSTAWGTAIINACERIAREVGCSVLALHHTGKGSDREDLYAARGTSALADAARVVLVLKEATMKDAEGVTNIEPSEIAAGRVLRLITAKMSYGPRQPVQWLFRAEGGVLIPFEPRRRDDFTDKQDLATLRAWWEKNGHRPLYRETIRSRFRKIFGEHVSRADALRVFELGIEGRQLVERAGADNPRAAGYVFNDSGDTDAS